jgi:subtilase family serine protease
MKKRRRYFLYLLPTGLVISAIVLSVLLGTGVLHPTQKVGAAPISTVNPQKLSDLTAITPMHPLWNQAINMATSPALPKCLKSTALPLCYSPQQMRQAYLTQPLLDAGITGKNRTITLIEAFQDPTIRTDLQLFDKTFGLADPQLNVIAPFGSTPFNPKDPLQTGFSGETALDVEWAHAMAPDATIDVIQANVRQETLKGQLIALLQAAQFAVQNDIGSVISMSFGASEQCIGAAFIKQAHAIFQQARAQKQTVLASAGDSGSAGQVCDANGNVVNLAQAASYPASDPLITTVGGTTLLAGPTGTYQSETTWNEANQGRGATGGGFSSVFAEPDFQQKDIQSKTRGEADLSFDADPLTGVPVVAGSLMPGQTLIIPIGGTSLGAPAVAGIIALFDQAANSRLGFLNEAIYRISDNAATYAQTFHDIQTGDNGFVFLDQNNKVVHVAGFSATPGWDPGTGVGTPNALSLAVTLPQFIKAGDGSTL